MIGHLHVLGIVFDAGVEPLGKYTGEGHLYQLGGIFEVGAGNISVLDGFGPLALRILFEGSWNGFGG